MKKRIRVGLIGDYNEEVVAHRAIPMALNLAGATLGLELEILWLATDKVTPADLGACQGLWCVPASPYRAMEGALLAIRYARERHVPFLGTCGGFQHAVLEYARNVLGWHNAEHAETAPESSLQVISPLSCTLVEISGRLLLQPDTHIARLYGKTEAQETYHCRFGLNSAFQEQLLHGPLVVTATDPEGAVRAIELTTHPFFVCTLFQSERMALQGVIPPLVKGFLEACQVG